MVKRWVPLHRAAEDLRHRPAEAARPGSWLVGLVEHFGADERGVGPEIELEGVGAPGVAEGATEGLRGLDRRKPQPAAGESAASRRPPRCSARPYQAHDLLYRHEGVLLKSIPLLLMASPEKSSHPGGSLGVERTELVTD